MRRTCTMTARTFERTNATSTTIAKTFARTSTESNIHRSEPKSPRVSLGLFFRFQAQNRQGTWIVSGDLNTAPVESQACTTMECLPELMPRDVSSELALT